MYWVCHILLTYNLLYQVLVAGPLLLPLHLPLQRLHASPGVRGAKVYNKVDLYWVPQKLPQIYTEIVYICIGKVA